MEIARPVFCAQGMHNVLLQLQHRGLVVAFLVAAIAEITSIAAITMSEPRAIGFAITSIHWWFGSFLLSWFVGFLLIAVILCIATLIAIMAFFVRVKLRFVGNILFRAPVAALAILQMLIAALAMMAEPEFRRDLMRLEPFAMFFVLAMVNAWISAVLVTRWKFILRI